MAILFIGHTRIGDAVLSTGLLEHVARTADGEPITVACGPIPAPLFAAAPFVEEVIEMPKRRYSLHWADLWRQVAARRWRLVIDLRNSVIPWTTLTWRRAIIPKARPGEHRVEQIAGTLKLRDRPPAPRLWTMPYHDERAEQILPLEIERPVLALGPTANWAAKIWHGQNFVAVADALAGPDGILPNARIAVFGAETEREIAAPVLDGLKNHRVIDLVGAIDLPTAYACLRRADLFIGHDSGLMHMAAASGIPTLGLFGPSRDEHFRPWGPNADFVRTKESVDELFATPGFDHRTAGSLMGSLEVATVVDAATALMVRRRGGPAN